MFILIMKHTFRFYQNDTYLTLWLCSSCWIVLYRHCFITSIAWIRSNPLCDRVNNVDLPLPVIAYKIHHTPTQCDVSATCMNNEYNVVNFKHFAPWTAPAAQGMLTAKVNVSNTHLKHDHESVGCAYFMRIIHWQWIIQTKRFNRVLSQH